MVGTSSGTAPCSRSCSDREAACSLVRGTSTRQPNSGRVSNQFSSGWRETGRPTIISAGSTRWWFLASFCLSSATSRDSVDVTVVWRVVPPARTTDTGVLPGRPPATRDWQTTSKPGPWCSGSCPTGAPAPRTTRVVSLAAASAQSTVPLPRALITLTSVSSPVRSGTPAKVGPAVMEDNPGATSTSTPASRQAATSSAPRHTTKGSPEYRRTTRLPSRAWESATPLRSSPQVSASTTDTSDEQWPRSSARKPASSSLAGSRSVMTTSARRSSSAPRSVSRSALPGPAPTRATCPGRAVARCSSGWGLALAFTYWLLCLDRPLPRLGRGGDIRRRGGAAASCSGLVPLGEGVGHDSVGALGDHPSSQVSSETDGGLDLLG